MLKLLGENAELSATFSFESSEGYTKIQCRLQGSCITASLVLVNGGFSRGEGPVWRSCIAALDDIGNGRLGPSTL